MLFDRNQVIKTDYPQLKTTHRKRGGPFDKHAKVTKRFDPAEKIEWAARRVKREVCAETQRLRVDSEWKIGRSPPQRRAKFPECCGEMLEIRRCSMITKVCVVRDAGAPVQSLRLSTDHDELNVMAEQNLNDLLELAFLGGFGQVPLPSAHPAGHDRPDEFAPAA